MDSHGNDAALEQTTDRRRLIIHVGDHKAGSTSIQTALSRGLLTSHAHTYPAVSSNNWMAAALRTAARQDDFSVERLAELTSAIRAADSDLVFLSAETLEYSKPVHLRRWLDEGIGDDADVTIMIYVRPHIGRIVSSLTEQMKLGWYAGSLTSFHRERVLGTSFRYAPRLARWRKHFGDRVVVRPMVRSELINGSVVQDFFGITVGADAVASDPTAANTSVSLPDLMRIKFIQSQLQEHGRWVRLGLGWELAAALGPCEPPHPRPRMHRALAQNVATAYRADAEAVDADWFDGRPVLATALDDEVEAAIDDEQSYEPSDHLSEDELRSLRVTASTIDMMLASGASPKHWRRILQSRRDERQNQES